MNKRFVTICLSAMTAAALALAGCGGAPSGDGGGAAGAPVARKTCVGDWTLAAVEADGVSVVGDLSALTGDADAMKLSLKEDGTGAALLGAKVYGIAWQAGEGGAVTLKRSGDVQEKASDAGGDAAGSADAAAGSTLGQLVSGNQGGAAKTGEGLSGLQGSASSSGAADASVTFVESDAAAQDGETTSSAQETAASDAASSAQAAKDEGTTEPAQGNKADDAKASSQDARKDNTAKARAKAPVRVALDDEGFVADTSLENGSLVVSAKGDAFSGKLIFTADGSYEGSQPIDASSLGVVAAKDAVVGDWTLAAVSMSGATLRGSAKDLAAALGITEDTKLSIKDNGTIVALGQQTSWELGDAGASVSIGGSSLPLTTCEEGIALDASGILGREVIMVFAKKA